MMHQWWSQHFDLLIKSGLTKKDITKAMTTGNIELRDGAIKFLKILNEKSIPLIILSSSGIGDYSISTFLGHQKSLFNNITIISNKYQWDKDGRAISINQPIIHGMNKDETVISDLPIFQKIKNRKNVILLGDSLSDTDMITGFNYDKLLSIGFLNKDTDKYLDEYKKHFDVIITNDGSMDFLNNLLTKIS